MKIAIHNTAQIGKAIKLTRLAQGLDQFATAGLSGTGQSFLSHLENGKDTAQIGKVLQVLTTLGIRLELTLPPEVADYIAQHLPADVTPDKTVKTIVAEPTARYQLPAALGADPYALPVQDADKLFNQLEALHAKRATIKRKPVATNG